MKKVIVSLISLFIGLFCFAEDYTFEKVAVFGNTKDSLIRREPGEVGEDCDATGNYIRFSEDGELYIQNWDRNQLLKVNQKNYTLETIHDLNFLFYGKIEKLSVIADNYYCFDASGSARYSTTVDKNFNILYKFNANDPKVRIDGFAFGVYYDYDTDILFYLNRKYELCCIVHPSTDLEQNKKNVRNHEQTITILQKKTDIDVKDLALNNNKNKPFFRPGLYKGDKEITFDGYLINGNEYRYGDNNEDSEFFLRINGKNVFILQNDNREVETLESSAIHPSGDLYVLRFNRKEKVHTLYRIRNTWDPKWRKEWYATHNSTTNASSTAVKTTSKATESLNVVEDKSMTVKENLRLRSGEETSSNVITTMQGNTKVRVIEIGKTETIDGIKSAWVKVEILSGKDKEGKDIKKGTTGWCFGGYLY